MIERVNTSVPDVGVGFQVKCGVEIRGGIATLAPAGMNVMFDGIDARSSDLRVGRKIELAVEVLRDQVPSIGEWTGGGRNGGDLVQAADQSGLLNPRAVQKRSGIADPNHVKEPLLTRGHGSVMLP